MSACMPCNGLGWYLLRGTDGEGNRTSTDEDCPECDGTGEVEL